MTDSSFDTENGWFRQLFESSPDPTWIINDNRFVECNEAAVRTLGYLSREEVLKAHPSKLSPPRQPDGEESFAKAERMMAIAKERGLHRFEWIHTKANGTHFVAEVTLSTIKLRDRQLLYCVWRDITERKKADHAVRESAESLRQFADNVPAMTVSFDDSLRCLFANRRYAEFFGFDRAEIVGKHLREIVGNDAYGAIEDRFAQVLSGNSVTYQRTRKLETGEICVLEIRVLPNIGGEGKVTGCFAVATDITERQRTEEALRASAEQFRGLVEQSIAGIYIIQDRRLAYVNKRFAEIFGYASPDDMIGQDPMLIVSEKDHDLVYANIRQRLENGLSTLSYGFTAKRKDGSLIEVGLNSSRASHQGRPAIIGLMQDITDKKQTEEKIQRYVARLETAFRSTVEVATTLSAMRDPYTAGHERGVGELSALIGAEMGFDADRQEGLRVAGHLHDIGKMTIPAEILSKPGKLNAIEYELVKAHAQASYDVLKAVEWSWPVAQMVLQHHERKDGSGYPQGLAGEAILPDARILAVADVVEAMISHRPYRAALPVEEALEEIERGRDNIYDAQAADACLRLFREKHYSILK
ncbi:MAG: PAS domain S-box protein [Proteobacteria bacterium]|nr:PAS domain S-box protein [Pseudomonadota bacterium]